METRAHGLWRERHPERTQRVIAEATERVDVQRTRRVRTCLSWSDNKTTRVSTSQPCPLPSFVRTLLQWCLKPGKEAGTPPPSCHLRRVRHLRMSSSRSRDSIKNITKRCWTWGRTRNAVSAPSSKTSSRTASCSGAGWTGRFGLGGFHQPQPCPPTCRCRRWDRRTTRRRFSTSSRRPRRHVGGPRWTGQCASFHCCPGRRSWRRSSCQFRTSWSTTTWSEPSSSGSAGTPSNIASASDRWSWGKTAGPSWWLTSSGTRAADGCWPAKATSTRSSTAWCWNSSLRGCPQRPRSGSSATARRRWTWPSNSRRTRWRRATGLANPYLPSLSLSLLLLPFPPPSFLPRSRAGVLPRAQPRWRGGPAPESAAVRAHAREAGSASPSSALFPVPLGSPRQFLGPLPATRVAGKPGPACWRCGDPVTSTIGVQWWRWGHWSGFRTPHRLPPIKLAGTKYLWVLGGVLIGLWWIQDVTKPRSIKA